MKRNGFTPIIVLIVVGILVFGATVLFLSMRTKTSVVTPTTQSSLGPTPSQSTVSLTTPTSSNQSPLSWAQAFNFPYPVSWKDHWQYNYNGRTWGDYITEYDLTNVSLGDTTLSKDVPAGYAAGDSVHAITLRFKLNSQVLHSEGNYCVPIHIRRLLDEEGDTAAPINIYIHTSSFYCISGIDATSEGEVTFLVAPTDKEFTFLAGNDANDSFMVTLMNDGTLQVKPTLKSG